MALSSVTVNLSDALTGISGGTGTLNHQGVYAFAVYFTDLGQTANWTTLIDGTNATPIVNQTATINLPATYPSGKIYFVIQSVAPGSAPTIGPNAAPGVQQINIEGDVIANAAAGNWRWDSVELTVNGNSFDVANLTSVNGFGIPMSISNGLGGAVNQRGYNVSGNTIFDDVKRVSLDPGTTQDITYSGAPGTNPLVGDQRGVLSPAEAVGSVPPVEAFKAHDWEPYIDGIKAAMIAGTATPIVVSGWFNGAPGAAHDTPTLGKVWHNQAYYAYRLTWDQNAQVWWLEPDASSQVKGYIKITDEALRKSIYATQGTVDVYANKTDATPYSPIGDDMKSGANNQWGAVLRDLFVGFTAGYYGATGKSPNPLITEGIDLNSESNWDPTYAFFNSLEGNTNPLTGATYDKYAELFYSSTNSYGSGYSDYLMKSLANGPLLTLWNGSGNTALVINLYGDADTPATATFNGGAFPSTIGMGYTGAPKMNNYIDGVTYVDLFDPTKMVPNSAANISFVLGNANVVANDIGTLGGPVQVSLGLWNGSEMVYIPLPTQTDTLYKTYTLNFSENPPPGQQGPYWFTVAAANVTGTLNITQLPVVTTTGDAAWYALKVTSADGRHSKIVNIYATADSSGQYFNPNYPGQSALIQADGLAIVAGAAGGSPPQNVYALSVSLLSSSGYGLPPQMLTQLTDQTQIQDPTNGIFAVPFAPVLGTGTGSAFKAVQAPGFDYATTPTPNGYIAPSNISGNLVTFAMPSAAVIGSKLSFGWWGADKTWVTNAVANNAPVVNSGDQETNANPPASEPYRWDQANWAYDGNVLSDYTNKIGATNLAVIKFVTSDASGTYASHAHTKGVAADLDGNWTTNIHTFTPGQTYKAVLHEYAASDTELKHPLNKPSDGIVFTVAPSGGGDSSISGGGGISFNPGTTGADGVWVRLDTTGSTLPNGTLLVYFTDGSGQMLSRADDSATTSLDAAVRAQIGLVKTDAGALMFGGAQSVYLPAGMQMKFAIQTGDGVIQQLPDINVGGTGTLSASVVGTNGTLNLSALIDSLPGDSANMALTQQEFDKAWVYLTQGETVTIDVAGSAYNNNTLHFVRIDVGNDAGDTSGWSVGGVAWGNTDAFRAAVQANWESGYSASGGRGNFQDSQTMTASETGYYAPVLSTEGGDHFVIGSTANVDGRSHIRLYGQNMFGFEDLKNGDWDYNDLVMKIV